MSGSDGANARYGSSCCGTAIVSTLPRRERSNSHSFLWVAKNGSSGAELSKNTPETNTPEPRRALKYPSAISCSKAPRMVLREQHSSRARMRAAGNLAPAVIRRSITAWRNWRYSCCHKETVDSRSRQIPLISARSCRTFGADRRYLSPASKSCMPRDATIANSDLVRQREACSEFSDALSNGLRETIA